MWDPYASLFSELIVKDYFLCLFSKRIVCKSEPEMHFYRKLRYAREDWSTVLNKSPRI